MESSRDGRCYGAGRNPDVHVSDPFSSAIVVIRRRHESEIDDWVEDRAEAHVTEDAFGGVTGPDRWQPFLGFQNHELEDSMPVGHVSIRYLP